MSRWLALLTHFIHALVRSQAGLAIENAALRQQLALFKEKSPKPRLRGADRASWVLLRRFWSGWSNALIIVEPEIVVGWRRAGFKRYWRWKSRSAGRPRVARDIPALIRRMVRENDWGAPRIHAELIKLGYDVSQRTVSRYMAKKPASPDAIERWKTFLRNHRDAIGGMDFLTVPTVTFGVLYFFFVIKHARRRIRHVNVTAHPGAEWVIQQLREAFPFDETNRYLVLDRDAIFKGRVTRAIENMGMIPKLISYRSPWQNGVAERWVKTLRRELLDHVVVFNEKHLRRLVCDCVAYYNQDRCHLSVEKDAPVTRPVMPRPSANAKVVALPRVGMPRTTWRRDPSSLRVARRSRCCLRTRTSIRRDFARRDRAGVCASAPKCVWADSGSGFSNVGCVGEASVGI